MTRRSTNEVIIGSKNKVVIGGNNPIAIQSMCNTKTSDVASTVSQIKELEKAGCNIIRVAVFDSNDAKAIKEIKKQIKEAKEARNSVGAADTFGGAVKAEMKLVRWPKAKEVVKYSIAVLVFVLFFAGFFYLITTLFALLKGAIK